MNYFFSFNQMAISINEKIRKQNYQRSIRELEMKRKLVSELEKELASCAQNVDKAEGFDVLAKSETFNLMTTIKSFQALGEFTTPPFTPAGDTFNETEIEQISAYKIYFDTLTDKKNITVKDITFKPTKTEGTFSVELVLGAKEKILDSSAKVVGFLGPKISLGEITFGEPAEANKYGNASLFSSLISNYTYESQDSPIVGLEVENGYVTAYDTNPSFGELAEETDIELSVDTLIGKDGTKERLFIVLSFGGSEEGQQTQQEQTTGGETQQGDEQPQEQQETTTEEETAKIVFIPIPEKVEE